MTKRTKVVMFRGDVGLAFTDYETEQLRKALLKETRRCAVTLGMKKNSLIKRGAALQKETLEFR